MPYKKRHPFIALANIIIVFAVLIFYTAPGLNISIGKATPMLILPLITAFACFSSFTASAVLGIISGILIDAVMSGAYCFNAILLTVIASFACVASDTLFNKNIFAVTVMALLVSFVYFTVHWLVFYAFVSGIRESTVYFFRYAMPSAVYSTVFIFPFYYLYRYFAKLRLQ